MNNHNIRRMFRSTLTVQILTALTAVLGSVVDGAVTGACLGVNAMTAYGLVLPIITIFSGISSIFGTGISIPCGRSIGAGNREETVRIFSESMMSAFLLSLILLVATFFGADAIAGLLGASGAYAAEAADYLRGFAFSAPAMIFMVALLPIMQLDGDRNRPLRAVGLMTLVNICGDLLNGLVLHRGLFVMALATTASYYVAAVILLLHFRKGGNLFRLSIRWPGIGTLKDLLSYGVPNAMQHLSRSLLTICLNHILLTVANERAVAAYSAIYTASVLCMAFGSGIGQSTSVITGVLAGEKDADGIRSLMREAMRTALVMNGLLTVLMFAAASPVMGVVLRGDMATHETAAFGFRLYSLSIIVYAVNVTMRSYYQAMHKVRLAYPYVILDNFLCTALAAWGLSRIVGLTGVWMSFLVGEAVTLLVFIIIALRNGTKGTLLERMLEIRPDFTEGIEAIQSWSAASKEAVSAASEGVSAFLRDNGAAQREAYLLSLAVEEMGMNIIQYGFADGKPHSIDLKAVRQNGCWILRVRDDCPLFDPVHYLEGFEAASPEAHIGIRMVSGMAKRMEYVNTLKMNNLLIEI